ncbi:IPT/TIG domain-containing protein [Pedobacter miscanthi]|uniref:IPT/TIG domain-containing protein n=1 Tax=Pedobacter miscanthi TaxID=2259170 RepID=UPI00292CE0D2|nr:IPT/TIG domain-containing protein [Pedobacter miscanthi]
MNFKRSYLFNFITFIIFLLGSSCSNKDDDLKPETVPASKSPIITNFTPAEATIGQTVTITGSNFGTEVSLVTITFDNGISLRPKTVMPTEIIFDVPTGMTTSSFTISININGVISTVKSSTALTIKYLLTVTRLPTEAGSAIVSSDKSTLLSTDINSTASRITTNKDATGEIYQTELMHAEKATLDFIDNKHITAKFPTMNPTDTTTIPYIRYTHKDDATKTIKEYRAYIRNDNVNTPTLIKIASKDKIATNRISVISYSTGMLLLSSDTDFNTNITVNDFISAFKASNQKISQLKEN